MCYRLPALLLVCFLVESSSFTSTTSSTGRRSLHLGTTSSSGSKLGSFAELNGALYSASNSPENASIMPCGCSEKTQRRFRGKSVLLTGASSGLGRSFALQLAHCGVETLILTARKQDALEQVAKDCQAIASALDTGKLDVHIITADLANKESVETLAKKVLDKGTIDVLINNGGVSSRSRFVDTNLEVDERLMQINFFAGAALSKAVVPGMVKQKEGAIIWISSVQGLLGIPNRSSYAASKFAVQGYCEAMRGELASSGVTVHCVSPGYIRTNLSVSAVTGDGQQYGKLDETTASGADPNEVAVRVLESFCKGKTDFVVAAGASAILAIWLRLLCPSLLRSSLVKRYEKSQQKEKEE